MSLSDYLLIALGVLLSMVGQSALIMLTTWLHERHGDEPTCAPLSEMTQLILWPITLVVMLFAAGISLVLGSDDLPPGGAA